MKKYQYYSHSPFTPPASTAGLGDANAHPGTPELPRHDVIDLSGRAGRPDVVMETDRKWGSTQDAALDLSGYSRSQEQNEALDLSKPGNNKNQSQTIQRTYSPHHSLGSSKTPPSIGSSRSPVGQSYSLLQAALNSNQPNAGLVDRNGQPLYGGGFPMGDRGFKPFASVPSRPLGFSLPHMALASSTGAIIHGVPKPIAITTPQPHNPPVATKSQSVSDTTVSVTDANQSISCTSNHGYSVSQSDAGYHKVSHPSKFHIQKGLDQIAERYMLQHPDGFPGTVLGSQTFPHALLNGFSCTQCTKTFKTKAAMKLHMTVHKTVEERQYGCQICQRRFLHRHHLVVHQRKHSGEKPFECHACKKTFMAIFLLHKHLKKHTRETGEVSEISIEQLKELQVQKMINPGPQPLTYKNVPPKSSVDSVVVLSDEENDNQTFEEKVKEKINEAMSKGHGKMDKILNDSNKEMIQKGIVQAILSNAVAEIESEKAKQRSKVVKENKTTEINNVNASECKKQELPVNDGQNVQLENTGLGLTLPVKVCNVKQEVDMSEKVQTGKIDNPFPLFSVDDEVELDTSTGELRKVGNKAASANQAENNLKKQEANLEKESLIVPEKIPETVDKKVEIIERVKHEDTGDNTLTNSKFEADRGKNDTGLLIKTENKTEILHNENQGAGYVKEHVYKDVRIVLKDLKDQIYQDEDTMSVPDDEKEEPDVEIPEKRFESHDNIFEKMYNSNDLPSFQVSLKSNPKGKKKSKKVKCEICSRTFHSSHYLLLHMAVHKRNPMLQSLKKAKANQMKALGFVNKGNVSCEVCNKVFKFQKSLNSHMRVHSEKLIQRKLYRKAFRDFVSGGKPANNRKTASVKTSRVVSATESLPKSAEERKSHLLESSQSLIERSPSDTTEKQNEPAIRIVFGEDSLKRYICQSCDNSYTSKQKLNLHALIHKDNCFLCDLCGKSFFRQITLDKHLSTHKLPRPFICDICRKSFIHRSSLMRHRAVHIKPPQQDSKLIEANKKFEKTMLDTYSMLREDQIKSQFAGQLNSDRKYNALDLTVKVRPDESILPPVLSPANVPNINQSHNLHLSPPLITEDVDEQGERYDNISDMNTGNEQNQELLLSVKSTVKRKPRTESGCSESDVLSDGNPSSGKKSRKTRVYQTSCRVCKEEFPNVMMLKSHMVVHNTVETHLYECHICRHRFTQSCSLLRHLKTSCLENRMQCEPCNKVFHRRNTFEQHMRLHQDGPPNLDGSFYDKRRDEAEVKEERESDIENNNSSKVEPVITPLTVENVTLFDQANNQETKREEDDNGSDSDARTYLYSEGEVHSKVSDLSEGDGLSGSGRKSYNVPQDLTKNSMTLNLLSAVCSDIRNAEHEEEQKRRELEEKQKELETVEILANLKRGFLQKTVPAESQSVSKSFRLPPQLADSGTVSKSIEPLLQMSTKSPPPMPSATAAKQDGQHCDNPQSRPCSGDCRIVESSSPPPPLTPSALLTLSSPMPSQSIYSHPHISSLIDSAISQAVKQPQVATTSQGQSQGIPRSQHAPPVTTLENICHRMPYHPAFAMPPRLPVSSREIYELSMNMQFPLPYLQDRLNMLRASVASGTTASSSHAGNSQFIPSANLPATVLSTGHLSQKGAPDMPEDLSVKKTSNSNSTNGSTSDLTSHFKSATSAKSSATSLATASRAEVKLTQHRNDSHEKHTRAPEGAEHNKPMPHLIMPMLDFDPRRHSGTSSIPPPLMNIFKCELCGKIVYSKFDHHLHMVEHAKSQGLDVLSGSIKRETSPEAPTDFSQSSHTPPKQLKITPPTSLNLHTSRAEVAPRSDRPENVPNGNSDLDSPMSHFKTEGTGSDVSDSVSSPSAGSISETQLREELRQKIYARRRSQGLDDLKVEFKSPEPTELTEEERVKLLYRRECNRQAAQRSRMRKKDLVECLLERLGEMPNKNHKDRKDRPTDEQVKSN